jgi:ribose transport system substrate-binding protein
MWVKKGELTATFLYATPGAEGLRQAIKHLNGEKVEKTVTLPTERVSAENVDQVLKRHGM